MADNYLERRYSEYLERKAASDKARQAAWKKRLDAYRKKLKTTAPTPEEQDSRILKNNGTESPGNPQISGALKSH